MQDYTIKLSLYHWKEQQPHCLSALAYLYIRFFWHAFDKEGRVAHPACGQVLVEKRVLSMK